MEVRRPGPPSDNPTGKSTLKRLLLAIPLSVIAHVIVALVMRPDYRKVTDFAVEFQVAELSPGAPKKGSPESAPAEEPKEEPPPPEPLPEAPKPKKSERRPAGEDALALPSSKKEETAAPMPEGVPDGRDAGVGSGICMHDLFAYERKTPDWLLYISMASFRETIFQKEFGNAFRSFDLGRRIIKYMGMNPADEVEALFVSTEDIFDWRDFRIVASYDTGEERLKGRMSHALEDNPNFKWRENDGGFEAVIPGEFRFELIGSGRVVSISHAPPLPPSGIAPVALPDNPFSAADAGSATGASVGATEEKPRTARPKQVSCIAPSKKKSSTGKERLVALAKGFLLPDSEGHFPVAILATSDPRSIGIGTRLGRQLGFQHALIRGYFTDPVKIEGELVFSKNPEGVRALAEGWQQQARHYAYDPLFALAGVSQLLRNLEIRAEGTHLRLSLTLQERQVLSALLFLQLQGKALERQLKSDQ